MIILELILMRHIKELKNLFFQIAWDEKHSYLMKNRLDNGKIVHVTG